VRLRTRDRTTPTERRARADALRARLARLPVRVRPPAEGDVTTACGMCGIGRVVVAGSERFDGIYEHVAKVDRRDPTTYVIEEFTDADGVARERMVPRVTRHVSVGKYGPLDLAPEDLARRVWTRVLTHPPALGATGGGTVTVWLCRTCVRPLTDLGLAMGPTLVEHLLADAGHDVNPAAGEQLATFRGVTFAARVLDARRRGRAEPPPNDVPWEHVRVRRAT